MEYYSDLCLPSEHLLSDPYAAEYTPRTPYMIPSRDAEYAVRNSVLVDGGDRFGVSAVVFDKFEELVWMGNQGGHVTSYYGPGLQKYTSFQIHESEEVRDIITLEHGIYCLTKTMLRHQIRRGIPKFTHRSDNMQDMQCLYQVSPTKLYLGGHQDRLIELDLTTVVETVIPIEEDGCAVLRSGGGSMVACGSANGVVALRDVRTPKMAEHTFNAHSACLSDLDMQGNLLITCGFTQSVTGSPVAEQYVIVWDVRCLRKTESSAWSVATLSPPLLLHFLPAFSGRAAAVSGDGHVALLRVNAQGQDENSMFQVDIHNSQCSVMDVSATSQALVFGDQSGHIHLFSPQHNHEPLFNNFSRDTEFADPAPSIPFASFTDTTFKYSSISLPPLATGNRWFNELPPDFYKKVYRKPKPIDPEVLKSMKMQGPIGYAPNPRTHKRNQMPYEEDNCDDISSSKSNDLKYVPPPIPKHYQKPDIRLTKHTSKEELEMYNNTGLPGLEATLPNSYCNVMLQVLYHTPPVKATLLAHTCAKEFCLSCELGFLFRMLDTSGGAPCQATNFLRAFRTVPEAAALGLILPDRAPDARVDLAALIQSWNRFILHQIHYEILETRKKEKELALFAQNASTSSIPAGNEASPQANTLVNGHVADEFQYTELEFLGPSTDFDQENGPTPGKDGWSSAEAPSEGTETALPSTESETSHKQEEKEESEISQLFAIGRTQINRCLKCNKEEQRVEASLACLLQSSAAAGLAAQLAASLAGRRATPAWCERCGRFTTTSLTTTPRRLPPILAINCGSMSANEKAHWSKGTQKEMLDGMKRGGSKPCRYGLHCARPGCRFKHPDRPSSSGSSRASQEQSSLPLQLIIRLQADGDVTIVDKPEPPPAPAPALYRLTAAVVCVEDAPRRLVAYIQTGGQWRLFNDLSIRTVPASEVASLSSWWKSPCVLLYSSQRANAVLDSNTANAGS